MMKPQAIMLVSVFLLVTASAVYAAPNLFEDLLRRDHVEQSGNITCMAYATMLEYEPNEEAYTWCDANLEHQREGICSCVEYIKEHNKKRSLFKRMAEVTEDVAKRFLESLLVLEVERARRPKTSLQEECCNESCYVQEVYDHCDKHFDGSIYDLFRS
ncbi:uncharacterized protein [Amphiura filiformis]|uniref:uncharacterized protein n=1 Tax=Amphiura filiformis TaxID=82378 RepID=UPI003B223F69